MGLLTPGARLLPPPEQILTGDLLAATLPEAWEGETTTALAIAAALSNRAGENWQGENLPWPVVHQALDDAFRVHFLERTPDSGPWPCPYSGAQNVKVRVPSEPPKVTPPEPKPGVRVAEARLQTHELQDLADALGDLGKATAGYDLQLSVRIELSGDPPEDVVERANAVLVEISGELELG